MKKLIALLVLAYIAIFIGCSEDKVHLHSYQGAFWIDSVTVGVVKEDWDEIHEGPSGSFGNLRTENASVSFLSYDLRTKTTSVVQALQQGGVAPSNGNSCFMYPIVAYSFAPATKSISIGVYNILSKENRTITDGGALTGVGSKGKSVMYGDIPTYINLETKSL